MKRGRGSTVAVKAAVAANTSGSDLEAGNMSDVSMSSRLTAKQKRYSHLRVSGSASLFGFKTKVKTASEVSFNSSDDGGRRTRRSLERAPAAPVPDPIVEVEVAKGKVMSKIPVIKKGEKLTKGQGCSKGGKKSRKSDLDSFLHTTSEEEEEDVVPASPPRKTGKASVKRQSKATATKQPRKGKGKGAGRSEVKEPETNKEDDPRSDTFVKEVHEVGKVTLEKQSSERRRTFTASRPAQKNASEESGKNSSTKSSARSSTNLDTAPPASTVEPPAKQPRKNSQAGKRSNQKNKPATVIHPKPASRPRPGPASRTNKPSARESYEPDSINIRLSFSSDEEEAADPEPQLPEVARSNVVALTEVVGSDNNNLQAASSDRVVTQSSTPYYQNTVQSNIPSQDTAYSSATLACLVDSDAEGYRELRNAIQHTFVGVALNSVSVKYSFPQNLVWTELYNGVFSALCYDDDKMRVGYLRLDNRTVKPIDRSGNYNMIFFVLDGTVVIKSTTFDFNERGKPYLKSIELFPGCSFVVPPNAIYSLENWALEEASLLYSLSKP